MHTGYPTRWVVLLVLFAASSAFTPAADPATHAGFIPATTSAGCPPAEIIGVQIIAAALCAAYKCPHRSYVGVTTKYGAEFLAENAFKQVGGDG
jgi:hypothetical protein